MLLKVRESRVTRATLIGRRGGCCWCAVVSLSWGSDSFAVRRQNTGNRHAVVLGSGVLVVDRVIPCAPIGIGLVPLVDPIVLCVMVSVTWGKCETEIDSAGRSIDKLKLEIRF